jgi:diaminohydroxyphosphoribosylaminopyrimidine deaminase/5-amino-6-(5-phosphoribosylamino)uracil reductase
VASEVEVAAMRRAVELAARGLGRTSPNPIVGCVMLDPSGAVVGEGWHVRAGSPHAEVAAIAAAGGRSRGATVVVTLEPCRHVGRVGPCTEALVAAGIARVVYAVDDPDPIAAGGAPELRAAGIDVEAGVLAEIAERGNEAWLTARRLDRPFVTWKYAASLDGRVAAPDGSSRWVTGPDSRADAHRLRAESDAVMVGIGTVLADDPRLTVRDADMSGRVQPLRVVVDSGGRTPPDAAVRDGEAELLVVTAAEVARTDEGLDPRGVLRLLHEREIRSVLLEGGPTLAMSFLRADLIDRIVGYTAPTLIGGGGLSALGGDGAPSIDKAWRWRIDSIDRLGDDLRIEARPRRDGR